MRKRLLLILSEHRLRSRLCCYLSIRGYDVSVVSEGSKAVRLLDTKPFDLVVLDLHLSDMDGAVMVSHIRSFAPTTLIMAISKSVELLEILGLLRNGVYGHLVKPIQFPVLEHHIRRALNSRYIVFRQIGERVEYQREHDGYDFMINGKHLSHSFPKLGEVHSIGNCILISGEAGSGKRMLAQFLHISIESAHARLVRMDATGLEYDRLMTDLERIQFESINGTDIQGPRQTTLMLENLQIVPQGLERFLSQLIRNDDTKSCNKCPGCWNRVIITTMQQGTCMALNDARFHGSKTVTMIHLKPLRERMEELPSIAGYLLAQSRSTFVKPVLGLETDAMRCLLAHTWPGNIEELRLVLEQGVKSCKTKFIGLLDLPVYLRKSHQMPTGGSTH